VLSRLFKMPPAYDHRRAVLQDIAAKTITALQKGGYPAQGHVHQLHIQKSLEGTRFYHPQEFSKWAEHPPLTSIPPNPSSPGQAVHISIIEASTIDGTRILSKALRGDPRPGSKIGVLNFASATKPGGGFRNGAQAQEESLARSSTLYPTLCTREGQLFYQLHKQQPQNPFYSHAMIYSPAIEFFRDDAGNWTSPIMADVLTSAAVNAKEARQMRHLPWGQTEKEIEEEMYERMARILYVFETRGVRNLVLGSFGTGVFRNDVGVVARIWLDLLKGPKARFSQSFDRVFFAIVGWNTYAEFANVFDSRSQGKSSNPSGVWNKMKSGVLSKVRS